MKKVAALSSNISAICPCARHPQLKLLAGTSHQRRATYIFARDINRARHRVRPLSSLILRGNARTFELNRISQGDLRVRRVHALEPRSASSFLFAAPLVLSLSLSLSTAISISLHPPLRRAETNDK